MHRILQDFVDEKTPLKTFIRKAKCTLIGDAPEYWVIKKYIKCGGFNLNVGCGDKPIKHTIGVDDYTLETYTDRKVKCDIVGDALNLPFRDASVDTVVARHIWEHLPPTTFLAEMARVIKPGGHLCIALPNIDYPGPVLYWRDPTHLWAASPDPDRCFQILPLLLPGTKTPWTLVQFNKLGKWWYPWSFDIVVRKKIATPDYKN